MNIKRIILIVLLSVNISAVVFAQEKFTAANELYKKGSYAEAVQAYEAVRAAGFESGALNFNLGNAYFKLGQSGKAVLNYERARRVLPRDADVFSNTRYALSLTGGNTLEQNIWQRFIGDQIGLYTLDELVLICLFVFAAMAVFSLWGLYRSWSERRRFVVTSLLLMVFMIYSGLFYLKFKLEAGQAVVTAQTEARYEPLSDSTVYFDLAQGSSVRVVRNEGGWSKIGRRDGRLGWVKSEHLERVE